MKALIAKLAAVVATLGEVSPNEPVAASSIYCALGMDLTAYEEITMLGRRAGWILCTARTIKLTDKGRKAAAEFAAITA